VNVNLAMIKDDEWVQNVSQRLEAMAMELQD
jgi:formiminotetrahydrofolate cyclodeaminase